MSSNQTGTISSSRFHVQQVSTSTRNTMVIDVGCQRCQHCTLRRLWPPVSAPTGTQRRGQGVFREQPEERRSHPCKE